MTSNSSLESSEYVHDDDADDLHEIKTKSEQLGLISIEEAKSIALEAKPGIIDDIDLENRAFFGGWDYEMEVLGKDGKEWAI